MPSRAEVDEQAAVQAAIVAMAAEQLADGWAGLGLTSQTVTSASALDAVTDLLWDLLSAWSDVSATSAADFFDEHRSRFDVPGSFTAILADPAPRAQAEGTVRWALDPWAQKIVTHRGNDPVTGDEIYDERLPDELDLDRMLEKLQGPLQRLVRQTGRATIDQSAARDPARPRVARVPTGDETCAFCLILAARGPVYRSLASAGHDTKFHDSDDCEQVVVWTRDQDLPEGYDPGELYGKYDAARRSAGSSDLRKILRQLRLQEGIR